MKSFEKDLWRARRDGDIYVSVVLLSGYSHHTLVLTPRDPGALVNARGVVNQSGLGYVEVLHRIT